MIAEGLMIGVAAGAAGWFSCRHAWWRRAVPWDRPRVLMYHMIRPHRPGARFNKLRVPPEMFRRQVAWLKGRGFQFVLASELFADRPLPPRPVCLTFDDGYADNLTAADPVLAEHGAVATLYLVGDRSGGWSSKKKAHHGDEELQSEPKLSDEQVRALLATGRWELGGHTCTHAHLPSLPEAEARAEISAAREEFARLYGVLPATFAYPFGHFHSEHAAMVRAAGFAGALIADPGIASWPYDDPMRVPRIKVSGKEGMWSFSLRMRGGQRGWRR